jgi:hypothetical protein
MIIKCKIKDKIKKLHSNPIIFDVNGELIAPKKGKFTDTSKSELMRFSRKLSTISGNLKRESFSYYVIHLKGIIKFIFNFIFKFNLTRRE